MQFSKFCLAIALTALPLAPALAEKKPAPLPEKKAGLSKPVPKPLPQKSQAAPAPTPAEPIEHTLAFEAVGRGVVVAKQDHDFAVSTRSGNGVFDNEVVFAGYGIVDEKHKYNSYRGMPEGYLKGKVVIAFTYEPQTREGDSLWMPAPVKPAVAPAAGPPGPDAPPEAIGGRRVVGTEVGPAGKMGKGGVGPWSPASSILNKARWAAERGAVALLLVDGPAQDVAEPVAQTAKSLGEGERAAIPVIHIRSLFFRSLLKRGGGGKNVDTIIEEFELDANKGNGSLNDETGVEQLRDIRLWGAAMLPEQKK